MACSARIVSPPATPAWALQRTRRSLQACGWPTPEPWAANASIPATEALLLVRAGAWFPHPGPMSLPVARPSGPGVMLCGLPVGGPLEPDWDACMRTTGGDFAGVTLPPPVVVYLDPAARARVDPRHLAAWFAGQPTAFPGLRVVHGAALDAGWQPGRRVLLVVTSLHTGGAERLALDLCHALPGAGVAVRLATIGRPLRRAFPAPPGWTDLSGLDRPRRARALFDLAVRHGLDIAHAHMLDGEDLRNLSALGLPVVATVHNTRQGWPAGLLGLGPGECARWFACARAVERELVLAGTPIPARTVWNGIDAGRVRAEVLAARATTSSRPGTFTLACIANPRPQKRLHLLPAILDATQRVLRERGDGREVRLIVAGEASSGSPTALACLADLQREVERLGLSAQVEWTGGAREIAFVLAEADAGLSCSEHEGLSLAHLEFLAAGVPVVASDAGGTREIAARAPGLVLVPVAAGPDAYARALSDLARSPAAPVVFPRDFTLDTLARQQALHYASALAQHAATGRAHKGVWFVTNNLSTGGAQSSLRRLDASLHATGDLAGVALLQEIAGPPTAGRRELEGQGIRVWVDPRGGRTDECASVADLLDEIADAAPAAVVFWNVMPLWKTLLAETLTFAPVFDVSPGEMYFDSLRRFFAHPCAGLPLESLRDYGARLAGAAVKYSAEAARMREELGVEPVVIPNGVALPNLPLRPLNSKFVMGTAARLHPQKRLEDLLAAFRLALPRLPACELRIAGGEDGDEEAYARRLRAEAEDLPVVWLGAVEDMPNFLHGLDLFVQISHPAGCPNASLEALAAGLPVVVTDVGGAREQVADGACGALVPDGDIPALADALARLASDPIERGRLARAGRQHVGEQFSLSRMHAAYRRWLLGPPA